MQKFVVPDTEERNAAKARVAAASTALARAQAERVAEMRGVGAEVMRARVELSQAQQVLLDAQTRAAGVEPRRTLVCWRYHKREFRGVVLHVSTGGFPFVRRVNADGELGETLSIYGGFEVLDQVWEGEAL